MTNNKEKTPLKENMETESEDRSGLIEAGVVSHAGEQTPAGTEARDERRKNRRLRQRNRRLMIIVMTILVVSATIVLFAQHLYITKVYSDETEFQTFAEEQFNHMHVIPEAENRVVTVDYEDGISYAFRFDPLVNEDLAIFRDQRVDELRKAFSEKAEDEDLTPDDGESGLIHHRTQRAMLIDSAVYDSGNGALTMAICATEFKENEGEMEQAQSKVNTYLMDETDLHIIDPMQVMTPDYKEKAAAFSAEYFKKTYGEDRLQDKHEDYLKVADSNYDEFVISNQNITFFFDGGTVLKPSDGSVSVSIPRTEMGATIRNKVVQRYVDPNKPMVALTYDDGPGGKAETRILKALKKYGAVATFFYLGNRVDYDKENVKKAYEIGCEIGNHSWDHSELTSLTPKQVRRQIKKTNEEIESVIGVKPTLFRPPYGSFNDKTLKAANMPSILWTVDTLDWSSRNSKKIIRKVKSQKKLDGKIILMHSLYGPTAKATEKLIPWLQKKGYQLVTVSELIKYKSGDAPQAGKSYLSGTE